LADFQALESLTRTKKEIVVVGGSFLGSELSCSLAQRGVNVTQVVAGKGIFSNVFPEYLSEYATEKISKGISPSLSLSLSFFSFFIFIDLGIFQQTTTKKLE
jgi:pyruvate/2-oxoglutarate dehydrogenase complex dihydrolipoamide dehydrogenase (E3) component